MACSRTDLHMRFLVKAPTPILQETHLMICFLPTCLLQRRSTCVRRSLFPCLQRIQRLIWSMPTFPSTSMEVALHIMLVLVISTRYAVVRIMAANAAR